MQGDIVSYAFNSPSPNTPQARRLDNWHVATCQPFNLEPAVGRRSRCVQAGATL